KSLTVSYATSIVLEEMKRIASEPVADDELETARKGFIERFPNTFSTKARVAGAFADDEFTGRYAKDPDYWKKYRDQLAAVTKEDVLRVAKKYLHTDQVVILVVGQKDEILKGHPDHPVKLANLGGGKITDVPLRDPL